MKEKKLLLTGGIILIAVIFFLILLFSGLANIKKYERQLPVKKAEYSEVLKLSNKFSQIKALKITRLDSPPLAYLENKIKSINLGDDLISIRPVEQNQIEAKFENLSGNDLTRFLYELQKLPFTVKGLSLKDYENDNLWTLKLTIYENT